MHSKINLSKIQAAHLCQAQEGTMYKIKTSLDYSEQIQKNSKRCREKKSQNTSKKPRPKNVYKKRLCTISVREE